LTVSSTEPDLLHFIPIEDGVSQMPCGHFISSDSMTEFLRHSVVGQNQIEIKCPAKKHDGTGFCGEKWEYEMCRKVGQFTLEEQKEFEEGFAKIKLY
jgi:hypothetical protein